MNIVYTGLFAYPDSSANSLRVDGVVRILENLGHNVTICPGLVSGTKKIGREQSVEVVNEYKSGFFSQLSSIRGMFVGDNTIAWLESLEKKPDIIILYGTHLGYLIRLLKFTKKYNIKLILDVVEWYDPRHLPGGLLGPFAIMNELSMRFFVKKVDGIITISEYLKKYYSQSVKEIVLIPPVFQSIKSSDDRIENSIITLCYVGTPGKKEDFNSLFKALDKLYELNVKLKFNFVGMNKEEFVNRYHDVKFINNEVCCRFHGKVSNVVAKEIIKASDFMLVFRPNLRFSNAGFPSKIPESLSLGTPVICNVFSDIKLYLTDGKDSFIIEDNDQNSFLEKFSIIFSQNDHERLTMRDNSEKTFFQYFYYKNYSEELNKFLFKIHDKSSR
jgi:glycosyltransferase involved in cell wall biosynthesis